MSKLFVEFSKWNHRNIEKRAWKIPEWAEIEAKRHEPGRNTVLMLSEEDGLGMEEWALQDKITDKLNRFKCVYHIHWWLESHGPRQQRRNLVAFWQRGKRGYSRSDTWGFDHHLAGVIAGGVQDLRDNLHGWPGEPMTFEEWEDILDTIVAGFKAYASDDYLEGDDLVLFEKAKDLFAEHYMSLWD